jgi:predicted glutamine amidotransferase
MGRMLAATGTLDPRALREAFILMAGNSNPRYRHEARSLGAEFRHEDGWGVAWQEGQTLRVRHSLRSCLDDPRLRELDHLRTDLLVLHARRASHPGRVSLEETHPFLVEHNGCSWAFCHDGILHDLKVLRPAPGLVPAGNVDSERLFYHLLNYFDEDDAERSIVSGLEMLEDYTALNCLLIGADRMFAVAKRHPSQGMLEYHALWEGHGENLHVVSSEPLDGIGCDRWTRIPELGVATLTRVVVPLSV